MSELADIVAYNPEGEIALIVEVKSRTNTSRVWATRMRRNMLAHGSFPSTPYFLLALPDRLYLWKDAGTIPDLIEPRFEFDATPFFQPYYTEAELAPEKLNTQSFEVIVTAWLNELIQSGIPDQTPTTQRQLLEESGLVMALKNGNVALAVPA
jgi:hypothetical protein